MSDPTEKIFRAVALELLSSPEQLDQLVGITRPADVNKVLIENLGSWLFRY